MKGESRLFWLFLLAVLALSGVSQLYEWEAPPPGTALAVDMSHLPMLALYSIRRMFAAYGMALLFSIPYGYYAASKPKLGKVLLPLLDVLQSVPILGFFPAAIYAFIALSGGSRSGVEMAAVFLIFTSQAWNMAFGVYEACTTLPQDLPEALRSMGLDRSGAFRALYLPAMIPKLVYNSMLSWAGGWYFLVACEIIAVGSVRYDLPGLGSYLIRATEQGKMKECFAGLGLLILIIIATDVLVWRPLAAWSARFRYEMAASSMERQRAGGQPTRRGAIFFLPQGLRVTFRRSLKHTWRRIQDLLWRALDTLSTPGHRYRKTGQAVWSVAGWAVAVGFAALLAFSLFKMTEALIRPWPKEAASLPLAMVYSTLRMTVAYLVALLWTVPVAVWAGTNRRVMEIVRPVAQIGASIPATALFPLMVVAVIHFAGGMNAASVLLILTGMQWYLLFNLLAGVEAIPAELKEAASSMGLSRWQSFRKLILPAMLPSLITGSVTGWGGGWNALIVSERITYAGREYGVTGIGAALDRATYDLGDTTLMVLSLITMVGVIVCMNHFFWRRLYTFASERFRMDL